MRIVESRIVNQFAANQNQSNSDINLSLTVPCSVGTLARKANSESYGQSNPFSHLLADQFKKYSPA